MTGIRHDSGFSKKLAAGIFDPSEPKTEDCFLILKNDG